MEVPVIALLLSRLLPLISFVAPFAFSTSPTHLYPLISVIALKKKLQNIGIVNPRIETNYQDPT